MALSPTASRQEKAAFIAASVDRRLRTTEDTPLSIHRVEILSGLRKQMDELRDMPEFSAAWIASVDAQIALMTEECRLSGHLKEYAEMSRPRRRALKQLVGGAW